MSFIEPEDNRPHFSRLGWETFIYIKSDFDKHPNRPRDAPRLARWESGMGGVDWLDKLEESGQAEYVQGERAINSCMMNCR